MNVVTISLTTASLALALLGALLVPNNMTSGLSCLMLASVIGVISMMVAVLTMED
ncbi:TPA: hypothetical protein QB345_000326 [Pasteurella multocida]|nr:hypothetical protein [Pasteurella multocida]